MESCRACGQHNHDDELFCQRCGQFLDRATSGEPEIAAAVATAGTSGRRLSPARRADLELIHLGDFVCAVCRAGNPPERTFCRGCGRRLRAEPGGHNINEGVLAAPRRSARYRPVAMGVVALVALVGLSAGAVQLWSNTESQSRCPEATTISRVHAAAGAAFAVKDTRRHTGRIVLQFSTAWPRTSSGALIVSICEAGRGEYWYFARDSQDAPTGAFVPASVLPDGGFQATSAREEVLIVSGSGLSINGKALPKAQPLCVTLTNLASSWATSAFTVAPPCNDDTVRPWLI